MKTTVAIEGNCPMTNHIHSIDVPSSEEALARAFGRTLFVAAVVRRRTDSPANVLKTERLDSSIG